jgi:hypothetical protein
MITGSMFVVGHAFKAMEHSQLVNDAGGLIFYSCMVILSVSAPSYGRSLVTF